MGTYNYYVFIKNKSFLDDRGETRCWNDLRLCTHIEINTAKVKVEHEVEQFNRFQMVAILLIANFLELHFIFFFLIEPTVGIYVELTIMKVNFNFHTCPRNMKEGKVR